MLLKDVHHNPGLGDVNLLAGASPLGGFPKHLFCKIPLRRLGGTWVIKGRRAAQPGTAGIQLTRIHCSAIRPTEVVNTAVGPGEGVFCSSGGLASRSSGVTRSKWIRRQAHGSLGRRGLR